ncbi:MAG: SPFH domain-containing protein [bacterium]
MQQTPFQDFDISKWIKKILTTSYFLIGSAILISILLFFTTCFTYIKPYEYGVKQINIGIKRGIKEKIYEPGYHFVIPFGVEEMHHFPKDLQILDLTNHNTQITSTFRDKAANIQTSDGFFVEVDVSILFSIDDPLKVIKTIGPGDLYFYNGLLPKAEPVLKETLGTLTTEEFYNPYLRTAKMKLAKTQLQNELKSKGINISQILIRYFRYSDEIQKNIEEKKLKDQLVFKNQAEARAAMEAALLSKTIEEGEMSVQIKIEEGNAYRQRKKGEQELYQRRKKAAANLLVSRAEAEKVRLKNTALQGLGSNNLIGLEMAKVLDGIELIILPSNGSQGFNPFNLEKTRLLFE